MPLLQTPPRSPITRSVLSKHFKFIVNKHAPKKPLELKGFFVYENDL